MPHPLLELVELVDRLRRDCPWDRAQTPESLRPYLLEECHELLEAIDRGDRARLAEELGDLLFEVLLLARIAEEGEPPFGIAEVARGIADKMVERHPHVFGDAAAGGGREDDPAGIGAWEARKHRPGRSRLAGVPRSLPALLRAHRQAEKAAAVGFDWPDAAAVLAKVREELDEVQAALERGDPGEVAHEYGDALMALASLGRHVGASPEEALRAANDRFAERFAAVEGIAEERSLRLDALDADALDRLWEEAKRRVAAGDAGAPGR